MDAEKVRAFETDLGRLQGIASAYPSASAEHQVIRRAALALVFVSTEHGEAFEAFLQECDRDQTETAGEYLADLRARATHRGE